MKLDNSTFDLQQYLTEGVEAIVKDALRATLRDPKESSSPHHDVCRCGNGKIGRH